MNITAEDLKQRIDSGESLNILDVREDWEYEEGRIEGSRHFSLYQIPENGDELSDWIDTEVIIHCKSGKRSLNAQALLQQQGFTKTVNVLGGFEAFKAL